MNLHYIWVGEPSSTRHDIAAVTQMRARFNRCCGMGMPSIYFWCLDRHVAHYQRSLRGVTVRGIEGFLTQCTGTAYRWYYWYGRKEDWVVRELNNIVRRSKETGYIRDIVNTKNAVSLLLLYTWGGYTLDSNIFPCDGNPRFVNYPHLKVPSMSAHTDEGFENNMVLYDSSRESREAWFDTQTARSGKMLLTPPSYDHLYRMQQKMVKLTGEEDPIHTPLLECWMMYSPRYSAEAWRALEYYVRYWQDACEPAKALTDAAASDEAHDMAMARYHDISAGGIIGALYHSVYVNRKADATKHFWRIERRGEQILVPDIGVYKVYNNTHKYKLKKE